MTDQPPSPSVAARHAAEEVEIVFTDRLHIKQHFHYSDTAHNIACALDAFAAQAVAAERERCVKILHDEGWLGQTEQRIAHPKPCTCHSDEAPVPCQYHYAFSECKLAAERAKTNQTTNDEA